MKILILSLLVLTSNIYAASFSGGDKYTSHLIEGRLTVTCPATPTGPSTGSAFCRANILDPAEYTYFIGSKIDADMVKLQATREDGSLSVVKNVAYDGTNGKSRKSINLWIRTVLQRPLLGLGKNSIHYVLTKNNSIIEEGTFEVTADDGGRFTCARTGFYYSQLSSDCMNPQNLCGRYFAENNYCN